MRKDAKKCNFFCVILELQKTVFHNTFFTPKKEQVFNLLFLSGKEAIMSKKLIKCAGIRAIRTMCQTAIGFIGTAVFMHDVNWQAVLSASMVAGLVSLLMSVIAGLPEVEE
jgi:hypothetical protein